MNERDTESVIERRLRAWLAAEAPASPSDELRRSVAAIPATVARPWSERLSAALGWRPAAVPRPVWLLLVATLLLALVTTTTFVGARLLESRPLPPRDPNVMVPTAVPSPTPTPTPTPTPFVGATVLRITCDGKAATLDATAVRAMPDGVHVDASATDGSPATVDVWAGDQGVVATTRGAATVVLPPGPYQVACLDPSAGDGPAVAFVIGDPEGLWKSSDTTCVDGSGTAGSGDGPPAAPAAAIAYLRTLVQLRPNDTLEAAGYPNAPSGWIRLVRDGQVVASWQVQGTGDALMINSTWTCPEPTSPTPAASASAGAQASSMTSPAPEPTLDLASSQMLFDAIAASIRTRDAQPLGACL